MWKFTISCSALSSNVDCRLHEADHGNALPFDQLECVVVVRVEVVHGVNHLSVEHFGSFVDRKSWDVGSTACASEAENQEVKLMHLEGDMRPVWG